MIVEIYVCDNCNPCVEATEWMEQHNIEYSTKGMVAHIDEYPTIVINGITIVGWSDMAKKTILEAI